MKALYLLILLLVAAPVSAKEGFVLRWTYVGDKPFTSAAPIDAEKTSYLDHILAGSLDNRVYLFSPNGEMLSYYEAISSVTSVASFIHDEDLKFNDGIAGSLDDHLYAFWRPYKMDYFKTSGHWWNYSLGDNVYAVGTFDYDSNGQLNGVTAGTGNYADEEYGGIYAFSTNGTLLWSYRTSSAVKILINSDLDSDNIFSDVVAGAGSKVIVLDINGSVIWNYDFNNEIYAIGKADFDLDGEKDDLLVGAGNTTYAINSHKRIQWEKTFNASISGITPVDVDKDGVIDYYLVSSGRTLYALKNSQKQTEILWEYTLDHEIDRHVGVDFDKDGVTDDIVIIKGNILYGYDFDYLYLPELQVSKTISKNTVKVGETAKVKIHIKNVGKGIVKSISYIDTLPDGLKLSSGNLTKDGFKISALGEAVLYYTIEAQKAGNYLLPPLEVSYNDGYGNSHTVVSNTLNLTVIKPVVQKNDTKVPGIPKIDVRRVLSTTEVSKGENITVLISIINQGDGPALTVNFEDNMPPGFEIVDGEAEWMGVLDPGEKKDLQYSLQLINEPTSQAGDEVFFRAPAVYYRDESGKIYEALGQETALKIRREQVTVSLNTKLLLIGIIFLGVAGLVYRRKKHSPNKEIDPKLEEKFIQVYLKYQKKGRRPTYEEMKEELGVDMKDVDVIVKQVKKKFGISPLSTVFSRIRSLKK